MQCSNNLRQMGEAVHLHHDALKILPHAGNHWRCAPMYDADGAVLVGARARGRRAPRPRGVALRGPRARRA
jgi:hypothetical protein